MWGLEWMSTYLGVDDARVAPATSWVSRKTAREKQVSRGERYSSGDGCGQIGQDTDFLACCWISLPANAVVFTIYARTI